MPPIIPVPGRILWFFADPNNHGPIIIFGDQPMAAKVCYVHSERTVNAVVTDHAGNTHIRHSLVIYDAPAEGEPRTVAHGGHLEWMPFQTGQARLQVVEQGDPAPEAVERFLPPASSGSVIAPATGTLSGMEVITQADVASLGTVIPQLEEGREDPRLADPIGAAGLRKADLEGGVFVEPKGDPSQDLVVIEGVEMTRADAEAQGFAVP